MTGQEFIFLIVMEVNTWDRELFQFLTKVLTSSSEVLTTRWLT